MKRSGNAMTVAESQFDFGVEVSEVVNTGAITPSLTNTTADRLSSDRRWDRECTRTSITSALL